MSINYDYLFKIMLVGDTNVGKSSILLKFADDTFNNTSIQTVGIDFRIKTINVDNKRIKLHILDSAGSEKFRSIPSAYYRSCIGIILVYDITNKKSFDNIKMWLDNIKNNSKNNSFKILIGNKCDLENKRMVNKSDGEKLAKDFGFIFLETSVLKNENINKIFIELTKNLISIKTNNQKNEFTNLSITSKNYSKISNKLCTIL